MTLGRPSGPVERDAPATQLSIEGALVATIRFADRLRPDARAAIYALRADGIDVSILSGDRAAAVAPIKINLISDQALRN